VKVAVPVCPRNLCPRNLCPRNLRTCPPNPICVGRDDENALGSVPSVLVCSVLVCSSGLFVLWFVRPVLVCSSWFVPSWFCDSCRTGMQDIHRTWCKGDGHHLAASLVCSAHISGWLMITPSVLSMLQARRSMCMNQKYREKAGLGGPRFVCGEVSAGECWRGPGGWCGCSCS